MWSTFQLDPKSCASFPASPVRIRPTQVEEEATLSAQIPDSLNLLKQGLNPSFYFRMLNLCVPIFKCYIWSSKILCVYISVPVLSSLFLQINLFSILGCWVVNQWCMSDNKFRSFSFWWSLISASLNKDNQKMNTDLNQETCISIKFGFGRVKFEVENPRSTNFESSVVIGSQTYVIKVGSDSN